MLDLGALPEPLVPFGPVHDVPPRVDVVRTPILILQVVRVLPDVDAENDLLAFHHGAVLVGRALDRQLTAGGNDPCPSAPEPADGSFLQLFLELVEPAVRRIDGIGDGAGRRAARLRPHDRPEHRVVDVAAAIVPHGRADVVGHAVDAAQQVFDALGLELWMFLERRVQIRNVRVVMLPVMNLHRLLVDVRLERVGWIRQRGK